MSSPFARIVAPATAEPSDTSDQPAGFPATSPSAQAAFAALVSKMHKEQPDTPDDDEDEAAEDESADESVDIPVVEDPKPVRKRKPRVKKDEEPEPATDTGDTDTGATSLEFDPVAITLSHSPDEAWVILHNQAKAVENRLNTITHAINEYTQLIRDLESEGKTLCDASANASRIVESLTATLVSVADGKPGQVGKVRVTVIDGDARVDPA
jgi:hypothetical protein